MGTEHESERQTERQTGRQKQRQANKLQSMISRKTQSERKREDEFGKNVAF